MKPIKHAFRGTIQFPNDYELEELVIPKIPLPELRKEIRSELYQICCAINDSCAEQLYAFASVNELVIAKLVEFGFVEATEKAKSLYLLVKNTKPREVTNGTE